MADAQNSGIHEYISAEFAVDELDSPSVEKELCDKIEKLQGLKSFTISHGKATAQYDPIVISEKQIEEAIRNARLKICEVKVEPSSGLTNTFADPPSRG